MMSIGVEPGDLSHHVSGRPFAYVVSIGPSGPKVVAHLPEVKGSEVRIAGIGRGTSRNVVTDPCVTLVWPPSDESTDGYGGYSLIADGTAAVDGADLVIVVTGAILHRPAG